MGFLWSLITPILMLAIYTFVFSVIFHARWNGVTDDRITFAINLFAGMIVHGLVSECINRSPTLVLSNVNYVKRVRFPLELLCWVSLGTALFHAVISLSVLCGFLLIAQGYLPGTIIWLPLTWLPLLLGTLGLSWILASLGVFLRDIGQITGTVTTVLLFLSPIFYPATALPEPFRTILYFNPLTFIIEQTRVVLIAGDAPNWFAQALALALGSTIAALGFVWFQKARRGFSDVL